MATRKIKCNEIFVRTQSAAEAHEILNRIIGRGDVDLSVTLGIHIEIAGEAEKEPKAKK